MNGKSKILLIYGIGGMILGIVAGIITVNNAVQNNKELDLSAKDFAKVGLSAMEVLRKTVIK